MTTKGGNDQRPPMMSETGLKSRGWTDALIRRFLPTPDDTAPNPHYRSGSPMRLYATEQVEQIEATEEFHEAKAKATTRQAAAQKAVETKIAKMRNYLETVRIEVPIIDRGTLIRRACDDYNDMRAGGTRDYTLATPRSDPGFLERITVNYLRHMLSNYEVELKKIAGKTGATDAYLEIKEKVLEAIADAYPDLEPECSRQIQIAMTRERGEID